MTLPLLVSIPHSGLTIPPEVKDLCILAKKDIVADSDSGAAEIYDIAAEVAACQTTDIARAIVDLNRAADDFRKDGVIKTHTCYNVPVFSSQPDRALVATLLGQYHRPYHDSLSRLSRRAAIICGLDCHTMATIGPPESPNPGKKRPLVCISNADGTCPDAWLAKLAGIFRKLFPGEQITVNTPFRGGYIIRRHATELPWLQLEFSRTGHFSNEAKREALLDALAHWIKQIR